MSQELPVNEFKWEKYASKFNEDFIKNYDKDLEYRKNLHDLHSDLLFLPKGMKTKKCLCNLYDKENYVIHIRNLKQALDHGSALKKVHKVIQFNQEAWLKEYVDMNTKLRKKAKNDFEKDFFKLMNNLVFGKTMENVRNHRDIRLSTTGKIEQQTCIRF